MRIIFALALASLLAACGTVPPVKPLTIEVDHYQKFVPPAYLSTCPDDPSPGDWTHESGMLLYMVALKGAADDCRDTLAALFQASNQMPAK